VANIAIEIIPHFRGSAWNMDRRLSESDSGQASENRKGLQLHIRFIPAETILSYGLFLSSQDGCCYHCLKAESVVELAYQYDEEVQHEPA
jgi:hypothetical protein